MGSKAGDKNVYWCGECRGYMVVIHRDDGVTPMFLACRAKGEPTDPENDCKGRSHSLMYPDQPWPERDGYGTPIPTEPTYEWYAPDEREQRTLDPATREHVEMGGLLLRPLAERNADAV
jgi:hypothetical protein